MAGDRSQVDGAVEPAGPPHDHHVVGPRDEQFVPPESGVVAPLVDEPVGGFGAGTFSRTYAGNFSRWHLKAGVHKYETLYANQFAMYQHAEGSQPIAQVLSTDHPKSGSLKNWQWDYPVGAGDYYSLYPKSWYDYRWEKFPAHVTLEQFSPAAIRDSIRDLLCGVITGPICTPSSRPLPTLIDEAASVIESRNVFFASPT